MKKFKSKTSIIKKRIVLIGDSLLMHRPLECINYEDTYGYLVKKSLGKDYDVIIRTRRANDTNMQSDIDHLVYDIKQFEPDLVFLHLGIVDCAPRLFNRLEKIFVKHCLPPFLNKRVVKFFSKRRYFFTKNFPKSYTKINDFEKNIQKIIDCIKSVGAEPIIINIAKTNPKKAARSYHFMESIQNYNGVLSKISEKNNCKIIDMYSITKENPDSLIIDGIHLSKKGSRTLSNKIVEMVSCT